MLAPREYVSSRAKTSLLLLGSLAFVSIAAFLPEDGGGSSWRLWCGGFFGLGGLVALWLLVRPQRLRLDSTGFTVLGGLVRSPKPIPWGDISPFFLYRLPRGGRMIGFNFRPGAASRTRLAEFNRRLGAEGALPKLWPGSPEHMVEELNDFREQALAAGADRTGR